MAEQNFDRIRDWEERTGGFINIGTRGLPSSDSSGVPF